MRFSLLIGIAFCALSFFTAPPSEAQTTENTIKVYVQTESDGIKEVVVIGEDVRYEPENRHSGKPAVLTVLVNVSKSTWAEYRVVAEFHAENVIGWTQMSHLAKIRSLK